MLTRIISTVIIMGVLVSLNGPACWAADWYVNMYGPNNPGTGSWEDPFRKIEYAVEEDDLGAGDTIHIRQGTYIETITPVKTGSVGNYITFQAYEDEEVIIEASNDIWYTEYCILLLKSRLLEYLCFKNLTLRNAETANFHATAFIDPNTKSHIILDGLTIESGNRGVYFYSGVTDSKIINCKIDGNQYGILLWNSNQNILIHNNHVLNSSGKNIAVQGQQDEENTDITITNNEAGHGGILGIHVENGRNVLVKGNHCHHNGTTGIQIECDNRLSIVTTNVVVENNLCEYNSQSYGSEAGIWIDDSDYVIVQNNIMRGNEIGLFISGSHQVIARYNTIYENNHVEYNNSGGIKVKSSRQTYPDDPNTFREGRDGIVVHNTFYRNGYGANGGQRAQILIGVWKDFEEIEVKNTVFKNNIASESQADRYNLDLWVAWTTHTLNYNNYYHSERDLQVCWQPSYSTPNIISWSSYLSTSGQDANSITSDPLFTGPGKGNFGLCLDSNCIDAGDFLTKTTSGGTGTSLVVEDARYFSDGYIVIDGDLIQVGSNDPVRVVDVNYDSNTLTLDTSISWSSGDGISYYPYAGTAPDIGCFETYIVHNVNKNTWYYKIQDAIDDANDGDEIVVHEGKYYETIDFNGLSITITSIDPEDPNVVANTIIDANSDSSNPGRVVTFDSGEDANSVLSGFTITGGYVSGTGDGAGIYCYGSSPTISRCVIYDNYAGDDGGGIFCDSSSDPSISNCDISDNHASGDGGAVYCSSSNPNILNCIISGNISDYGGGIYCFDESDPNIINCTFTENEADRKGGGIYCKSNSDAVITNCILWDDTATNGSEIYTSGSSPVVSYSDVEGGWSGTGNINSDPCFVDPGANDFHLEANSPCINTGDPNGDYTGQTDIDGQPRVIGVFVDIGADEVDLPPLAHWKFDEGSGAIAYDSEGDNDGNICGATWTTGQIDGALSFDGYDDYVHCENADSLNLTNSFSISAWFKLNSGYTGIDQIVCKGDRLPWYSDGAYNIFVDGDLGFYVRNSDNNGYEGVETAVTVNEWTHVVGTFSNGDMRLYKNGDLVDSDSLGTSTIWSNDDRLGIGAEGYGRGSFWGSIDDVMIFDWALSAEEVEELN